MPVGQILWRFVLYLSNCFQMFAIDHSSWNWTFISFVVGQGLVLYMLLCWPLAFNWFVWLYCLTVLIYTVKNKSTAITFTDILRTVTQSVSGQSNSHSSGMKVHQYTYTTERNLSGFTQNNAELSVSWPNFLISAANPLLDSFIMLYPRICLMPVLNAAANAPCCPSISNTILTTLHWIRMFGHISFNK